MKNFKFKGECISDKARNHGAHQQDILFLNEQ
jgi:hypothetical protein